MSSGVGKTTIASGITAALKKQGLKVQPYKCGPDYIDPSYLSLAAGLPCRNLDSWMLSKEALSEIFLHSAADSDIAIVEGVMGLYDGKGARGKGSTAEIAKWLKLPVVLIIDAAKMSGSAAAIALGFRKLDPEVNLVGVILNNTGSPSHLKETAKAIRDKTGLPVLGHLPQNPDLRLPERHLGLIPAMEREHLPEFIEKVREQIENYIDLDGIRDLARRAEPLPGIKEPKLFLRRPSKAVRIGVAWDEAFNFYYQDNLDLLSCHGAELKYISPLHDESLPSDIQGLYIGGGFPEVFARELAANEGFKRGLRKAAEAGMPVYAECGGLMYLSQGIADLEGNRYTMVGLVPGWAEMQKRRARMGYALVEVLRDNILSRRGQRLRGHMFHWSKLEKPEAELAAYRTLDPAEELEGFVLGPRSNVLASYLHLHFASQPELTQRFITACLP